MVEKIKIRCLSTYIIKVLNKCYTLVVKAVTWDKLPGVGMSGSVATSRSGPVVTSSGNIIPDPLRQGDISSLGIPSDSWVTVISVACGHLGSVYSTTGHSFKNILSDLFSEYLVNAQHTVDILSLPI